MSRPALIVSVLAMTNFLTRIARGLALATVLALPNRLLFAQNRPTASPLAGTWTLRAADEIRPDGTRAASYGPEPRGLLIIDADGRYSLQIFRVARRKFASGDKRRGTAEEYEDAALGMSSHIGRVAVDSASGLLVFRIELASFPNWDGTEQRRRYELSGNELSYQVPTSATGNGTIPISVWRRVR